MPAEAIFARDDSVSPDSWVKDRTTGVYTLELTTPGIASKSVHVHIVGKTMFIEARSAMIERLYSGDSSESAFCGQSIAHFCALSHPVCLRRLHALV